jgi:hypothetical protein
LGCDAGGVENTGHGALALNRTAMTGDVPKTRERAPNFAVTSIQVATDRASTS